MSITPLGHRRRRITLFLCGLLLAQTAFAGPPVARPDIFENPGGVPIVVDVLANDSAPDGHPLHVDWVSLPSPHGTTEILSDGTILFQSSPGVVAPAQFTYRVRDERGRDSTAVVDVTPHFLFPKGATGLVAVPLGPDRIELRWHDASTNETSFVVRGGSSPGAPDDPNATLATLPAGSENFLHSISPVPPPNTRFYYRVSTCNDEGCVESPIVSADTPLGNGNGLPVPGTDDFTVRFGGRVGMSFAQLLSNDTDPNDDELAIVPPDVPEIQLPHGRLFVENDGFVFWQTPSALAPTTDTFFYTLTDGTSQVQARVDIAIQPAVPVDAHDDGGFTTAEGRALYLDWDQLTANDEGDPIDPTPLWAGRPSHGRLDFARNPNTLTNAPEGFWYVPEDGFVGTDTFLYTITNAGSFDSAVVTVAVTDNGQPDPTVVQNLTYSHGVVPDPDDPSHAHTIVPFSDFLYGWQGATPNSTLGDQLRAKLQVGTSANLTVSAWHTPGQTAPSATFAPVGYEGALTLETSASTLTGGNVTFTLQGASGAPATGTLIVGAIDAGDLHQFGHRVRATNDHFAATSGGRVQIHWRDLLENDLCVSALVQPELCEQGVQVDIDFAQFAKPRLGDLSHLHSWGGFYYYAPPNYQGVDTFSYTIRDRISGAPTTARVVVVVTSGAPNPVADGPYTILADQPQALSVLANDSDPQGEALTVVAASDPGHGFAAVTSASQVTYSPNPGYVGVDSFQYTVRDSAGNTATATVSVTVVPLEPAIGLNQGETPLSNGSSLDLGAVATGSPASVVLTIRNSGYLPLTIGQITIPFGYSVPVPPPTSIPIGAGVTFTLRLDAAAAGVYEGDLSIDNSDPDDQPFVLHLTGHVVDDVIFDHGFEPDLSAWSNLTQSGAGTATACPTGAMVGTLGLCVAVNGVGNAAYVADSTPAGESRYRARFYFDPSALTMLDGSLHYLMFGRTATGSEGLTVFDVRLQKVAAGFQIRGVAWLNGATGSIATPWVTIAGRTLVEVDWQAATAGQSNGSLKLWVNETPTTEAANVANDQMRIEQVRLGAFSGIDAGTVGTHWFDGFKSRRLFYIGPEAAIFADGFEPDLTRWSAVSISGNGRLTPCPEAATSGSLGLCADVDGTGSAISLTDNSPANENHYRARFTMNLGSLAMNEGSLHYLFFGYSPTGASVFDLRIRKQAGAIQFRGGAYDNAGAQMLTPWTNLPQGTVTVELEWKGGTTASATDGFLKLRINGLAMGEVTAVANGGVRLDQVKLGAFSGVDAGTVGTHRYDAFESWR
jgi:hypothetical protein